MITSVPHNARRFGFLLLSAALLYGSALMGCKHTDEPDDDNNTAGAWQLTSGVSTPLIDVQQRSADLITGAGSGGTILQSTDNGKTWLTRHQQGEDIFRIKQINSNLMLALSGSTILSSADNGQSWNIMNTIRSDWKLRGITIKGSEIFITGSEASGAYGFIMRSTDMGTTFETVHETPDQGIYDISFYDANIGVAVGKLSRVYLTNDGGLSWTESDALAAGHQFTGLNIFADGSAITYGGTDNTGGLIFRSTDRGVSWTQVYSSLDRVERVSFSDDLNGVAVGYHGLIMKTEDGGKTWSNLPELGSRRWRGVSMYEKEKGIMVAEDGAVATITDK
jgi:photosystem II stability/assembly factor-like uncharacterized protein